MYLYPLQNRFWLIFCLYISIHSDKQIIVEIDGYNSNWGIWTIASFKGPLGDAIHMVIGLYYRIFLGNNTVSQSIVN